MRRWPMPRRPALWLAWLRLGLLPVAAVVAIVVEPGRIHRPAFTLVLAAGAVYASFALVASRRSGTRPAGGWFPFVVLDLLFLTALIYLSGGAVSPLRSGVVAVPAAVAIFGRPCDTLRAVGGALAAFAVIVALPAPVGVAPSGTFVVGAGLYIAWSCCLVLVLSLSLYLRNLRTLQLSESRKRLVAQAVSAEEHARRNLAVGLHDDPVQALLAARLWLKRAAEGDSTSLGRACEAVDHALAGLREAIFELHPPALEHSGLATALDQLAVHFAKIGSADLRVAVEPDAIGYQDELVFSLTREFLGNAVRHAEADQVHASVARNESSIHLVVRDDGCGMSADQRRQAVREGHIGLAASAERIDAAGGRLHIRTAPGHGTTVSVVLPAESRPHERGADGPGEAEPNEPLETALL